MAMIGRRSLVYANRGDFGIILIDDGGIQFHRYFPAVGIQNDRVGTRQLAFSALFTAPELFHDALGRAGRVQVLDGYVGDGLPLGVADQFFGSRVHEQYVGISVCSHDGHR
jgi:hypothetical protein